MALAMRSEVPAGPPDALPPSATQPHPPGRPEERGWVPLRAVCVVRSHPALRSGTESPDFYRRRRLVRVGAPGGGPRFPHGLLRRPGLPRFWDRHRGAGCSLVTSRLAVAYPLAV